MWWESVGAMFTSPREAQATYAAQREVNKR
jgi:hypothetical protein